MKTLVTAIFVAAAVTLASPAPAADWLWQLEQTRKFQKKAAEKRAAKERESAAKAKASLEDSTSVGKAQLAPPANASPVEQKR